MCPGQRFHLYDNGVNQDLAPIRGYTGGQGTSLLSVASNQVA
jgi:hypothetical protein